MKLIFSIKDVLHELFPTESKSVESAVEKIKEFFTVGSSIPDVKVDKDFISVNIDTDSINIEQNKHDKLVDLCERGELNKAKRFAVELIEKYPAVSEYHRILGQVYSDLGNQEEAINTLIDALRWNPENGWALIMMGNIFAKHKDDIDTAMTYYNEVIRLKPDDNIALNNIGANLMQLGKTKEARSYFQKALKANPDYPNTYYAFGLIHEKEGDYYQGFEFAMKTIEKSNPRESIFGNAFQLAVDCANAYQQSNNEQIKTIIDTYISKLKYVTEKEILIENDASISTAAKIEIAEYYNRDTHKIKYKDGYPSVEHLILHELTHLELIEEARKENKNLLFTSSQKNENQFYADLKIFIKKLNERNISKESIDKYLKALFNGINLQSYNAPIDLFIEDRIFNNFEIVKPIQFLSLLAIIQEGIKATTDKDIVRNSPKTILSKSKIYNLVHALHFRSLFSIDLTGDHQPTRQEMNQAKELYEEFLEYRNDKEPGEEYELLQHWAEDLKLENYFDLVPENSDSGKTMEDVLTEIEKDPLGLDSVDAAEERKMKKFIKDHSSGNLNMAVTMFMVDAISFFKKMSVSDIKKIAVEFATLGMTGIDPKKDGYSVPSMKNIKFSGYKALAYYYVSWALAIPEMLDSLQMPFAKEYKMANQLKDS